MRHLPRALSLPLKGLPMDQLSTCLADVVDLADFGDDAVALAAELREERDRDRATAQCLREYLRARAVTG